MVALNFYALATPFHLPKALNLNENPGSAPWLLWLTLVQDASLMARHPLQA